MTECQSAEIRDQLPDFVHGQLSGDVHAAVAAHVSSCAACASELTLLREVRRLLAVTPKVDVARIVGALPAPSRGRRAPLNRSPWRGGWRIAAAIVAILIGGASAAVVTMRSRDVATDRPRVVREVPTPTPSSEVAAAELSIDADLAEASVLELEALLDELEAFDGLPAGDPEVPLLSSNTGEEGL